MDYRHALSFLRKYSTQGVAVEDDGTVTAHTPFCKARLYPWKRNWRGRLLCNAFLQESVRTTQPRPDVVSAEFYDLARYSLSLGRVFVIGSDLRWRLRLVSTWVPRLQCRSLEVALRKDCDIEVTAKITLLEKSDVSLCQAVTDVLRDVEPAEKLLDWLQERDGPTVLSGGLGGAPPLYKSEEVATFIRAARQIYGK